MDGNSNSATLIDHRPSFRHVERSQHRTFLGPADHDGFEYAWWDEQGDASHTSHSPLSVAGFVRLGGLNRSTCRAKGIPKHRDGYHRVEVDVLPPTDVKSSFGRPNSFGASPPNWLGIGSIAPLAACSALIGANTPPQNETDSPTPEAASNVISGAIEEDTATDSNDVAIFEPWPSAVELSPFQQLQELSKRVKLGDKSAIAEIQKILNSNDALWRHLGDVEKTTEAMLIEVADGSAASKESVRRSVAAMKQSLLGEQPTPLERMAVGRVVSCWLFAHFVDRWCAWSVKAGGRASDLAKLLEASEKRYQISLRSLKLVQAI